MKDLVSRYRRHGGSLPIEMKLYTLAQLFNSPDPSPFFEKDRNRDAETYIVDTARAIHNYFDRTLYDRLSRIEVDVRPAA